MKVKIVAHAASAKIGYEISTGGRVTYSYAKPENGTFTSVFGSPYFDAKINYVKAVQIVKVQQFPTSKETLLYHFPATAEIEIVEDDAANPVALVDEYQFRKYELVYWISETHND